MALILKRTQEVAQDWINPRFHFAPCVALRQYEAARRCQEYPKSIWRIVDDDQFSQHKEKDR
jgi:hypothetical protein